MGLKKKINRLISININPFELNRESQEILLSKFKEPKNLAERSYFQFCIQFYVHSFYKRLLNNIIGIIVFPIILLKAMLGGFKTKHKQDNNNAIFPYKNLKYGNVLPEELKSQYDILDIDFDSGIAISYKDFVYIVKFVLRYPFQPYFVSKCVYKIFFFRYIINVYNPKAIISSSEYSFTSSILTDFCNRNGVEHINIMHGEKLFFIRDSFFEFNKFYVWDTFYVDLFTKLRASEKQFIVGTYSSLDLKINLDKEKKYLYTYYLAAETKETLVKIRKSLDMLGPANQISIRFHPRYSNIKEIEVVFEGFNIENSTKVSLKESFESTRFAISLYSSVLVQAYFSNVEVVVDNISNVNNYNTLKNLNYIILSKKHRLLSDLSYAN